jgi:hypothetical protein
VQDFAMSMRIALVAGLVVASSLTGCGGGGGGGGVDETGGLGSTSTGGTGAVPATAADQPVATYATTGRDGEWSRVDLIPVFQGNPLIGTAPSAQQQTLLSQIQTLSGTDLSADWSGPIKTLPTSGFDSYLTGLPPGTLAGYILGANNIYDLLQSTTGAPQDGNTVPMNTFTQFTFPGFTGGDIDSKVTGGDLLSEGGPGLFSNFPLTELPAGRAVPPKLPTLPNTMGGAPATPGRGAQPDDEHQFLQMAFPYSIDRDSVFNPQFPDNSFLGDSSTSSPSGTGNVGIVKHWVQHPDVSAPPHDPPIYDDKNATDQLPEHVPGIAVVGGISAIPTGLPINLPQFAFLDPSEPTFDRVPLGARDRIMAGTVFTYIANENPAAIVAQPYQPDSPDGYIVDEDGTDGEGANAGLLVLPSPTSPNGQGGRVFGATEPVVGSVNDFKTDHDTVAATVGFVSVDIRWLRSAGVTIANPYFHSFPVDQSQVGNDPRGINGTFNRGAAIAISTSQIPTIDILDPSQDAIGTYVLEPTSDAVNTISTRARFVVRFDREVVPNSVGFSRRHTLHSTSALGTVFPFNGNTRPIQNPINQFTTANQGSPVAASIYLAVNQPAGIDFFTGFKQPVASPYVTKGFIAVPVNAAGNFQSDINTPVSAESNGLNPTQQNTLASLPRGVVPVDIYPLNQNNLQAYVIQPLVELPPGLVVTLGVTMNGLGTTFYTIPNHGNHTRVGTMFTPYQALNQTTGLGTDASVKTLVTPNDTIVKVNAGPMSLDGLLFYGGTNVALARITNQVTTDNLTTGGYNVSRTFQVGHDNNKLYINAPVSPQSLYLGFTAGGAGVLDLAGNGYTTNLPDGGLANPEFRFYLESSRFLPAITQLNNATGFNWVQGGSELAGDHRRAFGILGRYTSGNIANLQINNIESDLAVGAPIATGSLTPQPGINEGSSGYETLVRSGITQGNNATSTTVLAPVSKVGIVTDIEVGDFLDTLYFDPDNPWTLGGHKTYNTPQQGTLDNNSIADPPTPNPPPLRFPVGLPHTAVIFDQKDLAKPPVLIEGNEMFASDSFFSYASGTFIAGAPQPVNGLIFLNPKQNPSNGTSADKPQLPNAGFLNTFIGLTVVTNPSYIQTGPPPKTSTGAGALLASLNNQNFPGFANPSGLSAPYYESRQQIGNFLFVADQTNNKLHALNSNTMEIVTSLKLPDPHGLGLTADLRKLFVSNEGDSSVSIVDADPTHATTFMTELKRTKVGTGPRAVSCNPDGEDVFVLNYAANSISIINQSTGSVRKTLISNGLNRPYDMAVGMREYVGIAFFSGTYHGFISNFGGDDVLVYESGPDGLAGIGFDNIIATVTSDVPSSDGQVWRKMRSPRGITFDANAPPAESINTSLGCFVAHQDEQGRALVSRIIYDKDSSPGPQVFNTTVFNPFAGDKIFEVRAQYVSDTSGVAFDVALPDYNRQRFENEDFASFYNLLNAGATTKSFPTIERNSKYPLAQVIQPFNPNVARVEADRVYYSVGGSNGKKLIEVFDLDTGEHLKTIETPVQVGKLASYFSQ